MSEALKQAAAYDLIDRFLRNNLYDDDYAKYSDALEAISQPAPSPQPAVPVVSDEQILEVAEPFGAFEYGDAQGDRRINFARAILALRPVQVPMTEDQVWHNDALMSANGTAGFKMDALMRIVRAAEAHHGITAKKEGA